MGFISLKYDFSFKSLMRNETVRKYFISDVLGISPDEIRSVRLANTFLWKLDGEGQMDDWIRLINAETEEEVDMIKTDNPGVLAAIREIKIMNLGKGIRAMYEAHMKAVRDRNARDEYVWDEGNVAGRTEGEAEKLISIVRKMSTKNMSVKAIAEMLEEEEELITEICSLLSHHPDWEAGRIYQELKENFNE